MSSDYPCKSTLWVPSRTDFVAIVTTRCGQDVCFVDRVCTMALERSGTSDRNGVPSSELTALTEGRAPDPMAHQPAHSPAAESYRYSARALVSVPVPLRGVVTSAVSEATRTPRPPCSPRMIRRSQPPRRDPGHLGQPDRDMKTVDHLAAQQPDPSASLYVDNSSR